jgi:hypothetical protein
MLPMCFAGRFLCLHANIINGVQPRAYIVMVYTSLLYKDFDNGKWAPFFFSAHSQK